MEIDRATQNENLCDLVDRLEFLENERRSRLTNLSLSEQDPDRPELPASETLTPPGNTLPVPPVNNPPPANPSNPP